ncbi:MAG TPA: hypothetical protein VHX87_07415 [Galbitalea sp.]|jgi:hypothetical protein|nr:hypothetical protein [Galbitalea sp.]
MLTRLPLIAAVGAVLLLTACGPATPAPPPGPTATDSGAAAPTPSTAPAPAPSSTASDTISAGTCTPAEEAASNTSYPIPTVYTVYNTLPTDSVTIHYTAFNSDGTMPVVTLTTTGPVINIVGYPCTDAQGGAIWTLTATHSIPGSIGCALDFGGLIVKTDSAGQEDPTASISCSGNPGQ